MTIKKNSAKNCFNFIESETATQTRLSEATNKELEVFLTKENNDKDATDKILDFLVAISDSVQKEFDELVSGDSNKKDLSGHCQ